MSKKHKEAIERQQSTPKLVAGVRVNCAHMQLVMELPSVDAKAARVWG